MRGQKQERGCIGKKGSAEFQGEHSWVLSLLFEKGRTNSKPSARILFSRAPSCCANEVKSDLAVHFLAPYSIMVQHAAKLTAYAVSEIRSCNA